MADVTTDPGSEQEYVDKQALSKKELILKFLYWEQ